MKYYYDTNIKGFITDITHEITDYSFELSDEKYNELLTGINLGHTINVVDGEVILGDKPLDFLKSNKNQALKNFCFLITENGVTDMGINVKPEKGMLGYLSSIAILNNEDNVIHDSQDIYHSGLTNADVLHVLQITLNAYNSLITYKKSKELEIASALDQTALDSIVIGTDFSL